MCRGSTASLLLGKGARGASACYVLLKVVWRTVVLGSKSRDALSVAPETLNTPNPAILPARCEVMSPHLAVRAATGTELSTDEAGLGLELTRALLHKRSRHRAQAAFARTLLFVHDLKDQVNEADHGMSELDPAARQLKVKQLLHQNADSKRSGLARLHSPHLCGIRRTPGGGPAIADCRCAAGSP